MSTNEAAHIVVDDLTMRYGEVLIQEHLSFTINEGDIFVIMGGSGCGKSTLLKHLIGLVPPSAGQVLYHGRNLWAVSSEERERLLRNMGVLYQKGALWTSMTLAENVAMPIRQYTTRSEQDIQAIVEYKLALVGLAGFEEYYPSEISGGMQKRAALARAMALDPQVLFFDEPSAGLDPVSSKLLDDLILELNQSLGATVVVVTHELASIFAIASNSVFLDAETKTVAALGHPREMLEHGSDPRVMRFLTRGERDR
jgi:phospholipid/cholesterol/gamma-HCH transport system ATP-binding protein